MPIYEYQCEACGDVFEALQTISAPPLEQCSHCGGGLERLFSSPALNVNHHASRSAERHSGLSVEQQARKERDRLVEHSKRTGVSYEGLFEDHEHQ